MRVKMSKPPPSAPSASATGPCPIVIKTVGRPGTGLPKRGRKRKERIDESNKRAMMALGRSSEYQWIVVVVFGLNGPLRQYFSLYRAASQREGERKEK